MQHTFVIEHEVIVQRVITVTADTYEQAESDMLKWALDQGLNVKNWRQTGIKVKDYRQAGSEVRP